MSSFPLLKWDLGKKPRANKNMYSWWLHGQAEAELYGECGERFSTELKPKAE